MIWISGWGVQIACLEWYRWVVESGMDVWFEMVRHEVVWIGGLEGYKWVIWKSTDSWFGIVWMGGLEWYE